MNISKDSHSFDINNQLIYSRKPCCDCFYGTLSWSFDVEASRIFDKGKPTEHTETGKTKAPLTGSKATNPCAGTEVLHDLQAVSDVALAGRRQRRSQHRFQGHRDHLAGKIYEKKGLMRASNNAVPEHDVVIDLAERFTPADIDRCSRTNFGERSVRRGDGVMFSAGRKPMPPSSRAAEIKRDPGFDASPRAGMSNQAELRARDEWRRSLIALVPTGIPKTFAISFDWAGGRFVGPWRVARPERQTLSGTWGRDKSSTDGGAWTMIDVAARECGGQEEIGMSNLLTTASVLMCPHGGSVTATSSNTRAEAGDYLVRMSDTFTIAGCAFALPSGTPHPCVRIQCG